MCLIDQNRELRTKIGVLSKVSDVTHQLLSNSRWRPLPGAHKLSALLRGK